MSNIKPVVTVTPKQIQLLVGTWYYGAHAEVNHPDACCKCVRWYSSNTSVATVNPSSGYIYANAVGTAQIIAVSTCDDTCFDSLTVTVANTVSVDHISLDHFKLAFAPGECVVLSPTVVPANATNKTLNWQSSNPSVATVNSNGKVCGVSLGTAIITAVATDSSGASAACSVRVTNDVLVDSVSVSPSCKCVEVGDSFYLSATVLPANATNKSIIWSTNNSAVASVNVNSGLVTTHRCGRVTVSAVATDGNVIYGTCDIRVNEPTTPTGIAVSPKVKTLFPNETANLTAVISPSGAANSQVQWTSGDTSVATVGLYTGIVTAINDGSATITATIVGTNISNTCTITVDSRERVTLYEDSYSFYVQFLNGNVWKAIGCDLSLPENRTNIPTNLNDPEMYDILKTCEKRFVDNLSYSFTIKQLAFLYLVDPMGIEFYVRNNWMGLSGESSILTFKDNLYFEIFGNSELTYLDGHFYFLPNNGDLVYGTYSGTPREDKYSNAELLFGGHTIGNFNFFNTMSCLLDVLGGIFPALNVFTSLASKLASEIYQITTMRSLLFSGSIKGILNGSAEEWLNDYIDDHISDYLETNNGILSWASSTFSCAHNVLSLLQESFITLDQTEYDIYQKVKTINYCVLFDSDNLKVNMQDILDRAELDE